MELLSIFMKETYITKADSRLPVKEIYEDFKIWIIENYDIKMWNTINQRHIYSLLKEFPEYSYVRYKEGYCLKSICRKEKRQKEEMDIVAHAPTMRDTINEEIPSIKYLSLNIISSTNNTNRTKTLVPRIPEIIIPRAGQRK